MRCAVLVAVAAMCAGCGSRPGAAKATEDRSLGKGELTRALLRDSDVPGLSADVGPGMPLFDPDDVVTASPPRCQPLADMMSARPRHARKALVWETLDGVRGAGGTTSGSLALSSHTEAEARAWVAELKEAVPECGGFRARSAAGWEYGFTVKDVAPVEAGDEAVSYLITNASAPGGKGNVESVVRTGGTLSQFLLPQGEGDPVAVPEAVARRQHERLLDVRG
ncbi:hypothetical protein ACIP98_37265 [Streptomyces sp. NPDC088354]|uniref:hypothetical protein n=1 Tax=unclassified Streptomyces TaxID=2593676 RepID=UPI0029A1C788|nr:hypothetical protein [Streptomyces sp. MI02-7b]MDX3075322.1 hypothetical protein [Streptomyces sp. MI02-7b]